MSGTGSLSEAEMFCHFHSGDLQRCPRCGRMIFQPCLACLAELSGTDIDPFDEEPPEQDILHIQLFGRERQRYERFHLEKAVAAAEQNNIKQ